MKKKIIILIISLFMIGSIIFIFVRKNNNLLSNEGNSKMKLERTGWDESIPPSFKNKAKNQGKLEKVSYDTLDYTNNKKIKKEAVVYLPYDYDESKEYNIFYLMHGWTGHAGDFFEYSKIVNILDNMIENKEIEPLIVVAATFDSENVGQSWERSVEELEPFHLDFENALMPYIESHYSTYAKSTSKEDLISSREHRAFGGFSLGGVTTWWMFKYDLDYIKYFLPMSGDAWYVTTFGGLYYPKETVDEIEKVVKNNDRDYFIAAYLGTRDVRYDQVNNQMVEMLKRGTFNNSFVYYQVKDAYHDMNATDIDIYNGLKLLFKKKGKSQ